MIQISVKAFYSHKMKKELYFLICGLATVSLVSASFPQKDHLVSSWAFNKIDHEEDVKHRYRKGMQESEIIHIYSVTDDISGDKAQVFGSWFTLVDGIEGNAIQLDGNSSYILLAGEKAPVVSGDFSLGAWISLASYPTNWCPIVDHSTVSGKGFFLGIDAYGCAGFNIKAGSEWVEIRSEEKIPLRKWYHIAGVYNEGEGISIYVNGKKEATVPVSGKFQSAGSENLIVGKHSIKNKPEGTIRQNATAPVYTFFDGLIDEINIWNTALTADEVAGYVSPHHPGKASVLKPRSLPAGPTGPSRFGASYTTLEYYEAWDALWRVGDYADVVVSFDTFDGRFVFWRGTSYIPHWVTENGIWYNNEFNETWSKQGCHEPMSDKRCEHAHVRIIENNDARVVVHWRYALVDIWYNIAKLDSLTGWGDWTDEVYTIYPDGLAVRAVTLHSSQPQAHHEWHESIVVLGPGQRPEEVLEPKALTLANLKGETHTFSWEHGIPSEADENGFVHVPRDAVIHQVNTKSELKPFVIVSPESNPKWDIFNHALRPDICIFPWWNHWPTAQIPSDGRYAMDSDQASSTSLSHCRWDAYAATDESMTKLMLNGLTPLAADELIPLTRSWSYPPELLVETLGVMKNLGYEPAERAYRLEMNKGGAKSQLNLTLKGSKDSPVVNPCIVIRNWGNSKPSLKLDGKRVQEGQNYRIGFRNSMEGSDLIIWLQKNSEKEVRIILNDFKKQKEEELPAAI